MTVFVGKDTLGLRKNLKYSGGEIIKQEDIEVKEKDVKGMDGPNYNNDDQDGSDGGDRPSTVPLVQGQQQKEVIIDSEEALKEQERQPFGASDPHASPVADKYLSHTENEQQQPALGI